MKLCWEGASSLGAASLSPAVTVACASHQVPGAEDQTALSLEECLRLLEATFPFGDNSEVRGWGDGFCPPADPQAAASLSPALRGRSYPDPRLQSRQEIGLGCFRRFQAWCLRN